MIKKTYRTESERTEIISSLPDMVLVGDAIHTDENYLLFVGLGETEPYALEIPPTETEILGQQLVEKDLQVFELQQQNQTLGQQLIDIDLRLLLGGI